MTGGDCLETVIKISNLHFEYTDDDTGEKYEILKGIDLDIKHGEFVAVLGHNGSGKSTLAKHLNAILIPTSGKVEVEGYDTSDENIVFEIRQRVGMVFQNPDNQMVANIVEEDVAFAPENLGIPSDQIRKRVDAALETVGMSAFKHHAPHMLSGGQKQRVAIAGVLAMQPDVIVLDEPTAMLDPIGRKEIMEAVKILNKQHNMTVILITHYMDEAVQADRVVVIDSGKICMDAPPSEVFSQVKRLKEYGLDVPQATELVYKLNRAGLDIKNVLFAEDCVEKIFAAYEKMNNLTGD